MINIGAYILFGMISMGISICNNMYSIYLGVRVSEFDGSWSLCGIEMWRDMF